MLKTIFTISNGKKKIEIKKSLRIAVEALGSDLRYIFENKDKFINSTRINRYIKELKKAVRKNMVTAATNGFGTSSPVYYISAKTIIKVLKSELATKEISKLNAELSQKAIYDTSIAYLKDDINYFSEKRFKDKYFSVNGQHRMTQYISDLTGKLPKTNAEIQFAPFIVNDKEIKFESLKDLETKCTSTNPSKQIKEFKGLSVEETTNIYLKYLSECPINIIEITEADSFEDIAKFIWYSNSSTSWSEFLHKFKLTKNPFTIFVRDNIASETTDSSVGGILEMLYGKANQVKFGTGKFQKKDGGFEYLISVIADTCYYDIKQLQRFGFKNEQQMLSSILSKDCEISESDLKSMKSDLLKVAKVFNKIGSNENNNEALTAIISKPSMFILSIFLYNYITKVFQYMDSSGRIWKPKIELSNLENVITDFIAICEYYNNPMHPINTYYWETEDGKQTLDKVNQSSRRYFTSKEEMDDSNFLKSFKSIETKCKESQYDKNNIDKAFRKHIGDSFVTGWHDKHDTIVNVVNENLKSAFISKMENKQEDGYFSDINWTDATTMPSYTSFLPSFGNASKRKAELFGNTKHKGHIKSKSKRGTNTIDNLDLENPLMNISTQNVV